MNKKNQPEIFEKALKLVNFTDKKTDVEGTQFESDWSNLKKNGWIF